MQHGQKITDGPKRLLRAAGFKVRDVPEGHICCGSAGVYNILQPEIAGRLRARKVGNIERLRPQIIATLQNKFSLNEEIFRVLFTLSPEPKPAK